METIRVQILMGDEDYGSALGEALKRSYGGFIIYLGQGNSAGEKKEKAIGEADIVLFDDMRRKSDRCVYLVEKPSQVDEEKHIYYKYDTGRNLANNVLSSYSRMVGRRIIYSSKKNPFLLGIHSASGGSGSTSVALAMCQELQRFRGLNTLYISMDEFDSAQGYFSCGGTKGMRDYLYYVIAEEEERYSFIEEYLRFDDYGVEAFNSFSGRNPLADLTENEFRAFLSVIFASGRYDAILFDCGNNTFESSLCAMRIADKLLFIKGEDGRDKPYLTYLQHRCSEDVWEKMMSVVNLHEELTENLHDEKKEDAGEAEEDILSISRDHGSFIVSGEKKSISLDTDLGTDIKNLLDLLMR